MTEDWWRLSRGTAKRMLNLLLKHHFNTAAITALDVPTMRSSQAFGIDNAFDDRVGIPVAGGGE